MDTIYAVSSGRAPTGVAVVRVSGPQCRFVLETMCGSVPTPRLATLTSIRDRDGSLLDRGLVLWFPGPGSFTGEDVAEFQVHGSRAVLTAIARALGSFDGLRAAEAGEFTRRAFLSGKIDLTEAEGLADLLAAETEAQRRQALAQSGGALRALYEGWRSRLIRARALIEAELDFADEEDIPGSVADEAFAEIEALVSAVRAHLAAGAFGERVREGFQVVLLGAPNAGKSSLLNALAKRDVAIVSEEAGTTRDVIELHLDIGGYAVTLVDTAGLRDGGGAVEREGMRRAMARGRAADLVLWLLAPDGEAGVAPELDGVPVWRVETKRDLVGDRTEVDAEIPKVESCSKRLFVSAQSGEGLGELLSALREQIGPWAGGGQTGWQAVPTRERHRGELSEAVRELDAALAARMIGLELAAEGLRRAADRLGRITGRIDVEDLLDVIFGEFCIGK